MVAIYDKVPFNLSYAHLLLSGGYKSILEIVPEIKESKCRKGVRNVDI